MDPEQPGKPAVKKSKNGKKPGRLSYPLKIFCITFLLSAAFSFGSGEVLSDAGYAVSVTLIILIICVNIAFDIIGTAVTAAEERPLHSMSSRKVNGSREAVALIKNAEKVSNFCNDVVGDIAGIISGACGAVLIVQLSSGRNVQSILYNLGITALIAALTVGGKAYGKGFAIRNAVQIVFFIGRVIYFFTHLFVGRDKRRKSS